MLFRFVAFVNGICDNSIQNVCANSLIYKIKLKYLKVFLKKIIKLTLTFNIFLKFAIESETLVDHGCFTAIPAQWTAPDNFFSKALDATLTASFVESSSEISACTYSARSLLICCASGAPTSGLTISNRTTYPPFSKIALATALPQPPIPPVMILLFF